MSSSYTSSQTFTVTNAKHLASKVATDLKRMQRFYNYPTDTHIQELEAELTEYIKKGYLLQVTYGFKRDGKWIEPTLRYTAQDLAGMNSNDDDPGRIQPNADVSGASFYSYLEQNSVYNGLTDAQKSAFKDTLSVKRSGAPAPGVDGYLQSDKTYSSGGQALNRSSVKSL